MSYLKHLGVVFCLVIMTSCSKDKWKKIHIKNFSISVPSNWEYREEDGIDSYVCYFITGNKDTLHLDYGFYSNDLSDDGRRNIVVPESLRGELQAEGRTMSRFIFVPKQEDILPMREKLRTQRFDTVNISDRRAKITIPKEIGKGITGIHFDSLGFELGMPVKLTLYGNNLSEESHSELLEVFKTIQF